MSRRRSLRGALFLGTLTLGWAGGPILAGPAGAQDEASREQATLAEEQVLLRRQLRRLRDTMTTLAQRFEAEGRVNAAELLRKGLTHLDLRGLQNEARTLDELMDNSREDIRAGRTHNALEAQERVIAGLSHLLDILLDRRGLENLDDELQELREIRAALSELAEAEKELEQGTEELRQDSKNDEQLALEEAIAEAIGRQRELLAEGERSARESGLFDLERIRERLDELLAEQELSAELFGKWTPEDTPRLEALRAPLERAREAGAQAARLEQAAERLEAAAEAARSAGSAAEAEASAEALSRDAQREQRQARASQDPAAERSAQALSRSAEELAAAGDAGEREAAARSAEARARQLEEAAREARGAAEQAAEEARERARQMAGQPTTPTTAGLSAARVAELLERGGREGASPGDRSAENRSGEGQPPGDRPRTEEALEALEEGLAHQAQMGDALRASQEAGQREARELARELGQATERSPQEGGPLEGGEEAREALERAAEAMGEAAESARTHRAEEGRSAAESARRSLDRARAALEGAMRDAAQSSPSQGQSQAQRQAAQSQLAQDVGQMGAQASQGSLGEEAAEQVSEALDQAQQAMQAAAQSMSEAGGNAQAARSQREAGEALEEALRAAQEGVEPQTDEQRQRAEELAERQREIREKLLNLARRNEERESPLSQADLQKAAQSASEAEQSLESGDLNQAQEQEEQTEREIREAMDELEEEEEQYQRLRQEELLFRMAEEIDDMLEMVREQMRTTRELHISRADRVRLSRSDRIRLRNISREFATIGQRATKLREAIEKEGVLVFTEAMRNVESDLNAVARDMGEVGGYQSGKRIQALQEDVETSLEWLAAALAQEMERRQQQQQPGSDAPPSEPSLVPDVAELKLLRQMEVEVLERLQQQLELHPELADPETRLEPLMAEDLSRLAYKHNRIAELFARFRRKLGIPGPDGPQSEDGGPPVPDPPVPDPPGPDPEKGDRDPSGPGGKDGNGRE